MNFVLSDIVCNNVCLPWPLPACCVGFCPLGGATYWVFKCSRTLGTSVWPSGTTRKFPSLAFCTVFILRPAVKAAGQRAGRPSMRTLGSQRGRQSGSGDSLGPCCNGVSPLQRLGAVVRSGQVPSGVGFAAGLLSGLVFRPLGAVFWRIDSHFAQQRSERIS